jgi:hypothetical protein
LDARGDPAFATSTGIETNSLFSQFASVPAVVDAAHLTALERLAQLLDAALRAIVARYFVDSRIRAIYRLPESLNRILRQSHDRPYRVGYYRPDFVYDTAGQPRICEIGARYPLNGWMVSRLAAEAYGPAAERLGLRTQIGQHAFLRDLLTLHPPGSTVAMVHEREAGTELFQLREALRRQGTDFVQVAPGRLGAVRGRLTVDGRPIDRAILELDRSELTMIADDVLAALLDGEAYFNDVRTLILVHDKRVLAVLWDEAIMRDYLPANDLAALRPYLIPSWAPASLKEAESLQTRPENLIAKRNSGGRGLGTVVRDGSDLAQWWDLVRGHWTEYMFQSYLPQRAFVSPDDDSGEARIHLVGMQLCRDALSCGLGVFRGSDQAVINLHQNRGRLYQTLVRP